MSERVVPDLRISYAERDGRTHALLAKVEQLPTAEANQVHEEAILINRPLAQALARQYRGRGVEDDDLEQVAMLGLCKAVHGYRPRQDETSFAAFAVPTITGELKRHFRDCGWLVRPTRSMQEVSQLVRTAMPTLTQRLHRQPQIIDQAQLAQGLYQGWSLDAPVAGSATLLSDTLADARDPFAPVDAALTLAPAVAQLTPRERNILRLRFLENLTQEQIGQVIGVSQMQVSRLLAETLAKLRAHINSSRAA